MMLYVNGNAPVELSRVDPMASTGGINCQVAMIYVASIEYSSSDNNPTLNITFESRLNDSAVYGINSLLIRYGNCDKSCDTCFGSSTTNC
jgi:hypothetical protein